MPRVASWGRAPDPAISLPQAFKVRGQLDAMGATSTKITVTSDLDEYVIARCWARPPSTLAGVGTRLA